MFITAFTSARHLSLSWASSIQSIPPTPHFLKSHLNIILPSKPGSSKWTLYPPTFFSGKLSSLEETALQKITWYWYILVTCVWLTVHKTAVIYTTCILGPLYCWYNWLEFADNANFLLCVQLFEGKSVIWTALIYKDQVSVPCRAVPCRALPCRDLPCRALPCLAVPCHALPCHAVPCPV